ncbi:MAG: hypothetical protein COA84_13920 [Robiginitomaculum sp.]|nr:MAG: hypothetical protein COA84_13920 [Robiginitomaculum sp.]
MQTIYLGQYVHANFGAMIPILEGMITNFELDGTVTWETAEGEEWETQAGDFKQPGEKSVNGSGIGIFLGEYA